MKKTKLLMPLAGITALGAIAPVVTLASCNNGNAVTEITATTLKSEVYVGQIITRSDINVVATKQDGTKETVTDWTCDDLPEAGYQFHKTEEKTFTIKYSGKETTVTVEAIRYGLLAFSTVPMNLVANTAANFTTTVTPHIYGVTWESELQEIPLDDLKIKSGDTTKIKVNDDKTLTAVAETTADTPVTLTAHWKNLDDEITEYDAVIQVAVTNATAISNATGTTTTGATITLASGDSDTTILNVPETVTINGTTLPVTSIAGTSPTKAQTLVLPETIRNITATFGDTTDHLQNVIFMGTSDVFKSDVRYVNDWAGSYLTGAWCYGDEEPTFVNFDNHADAKYDASSQEFNYTFTNFQPRRTLVVGFDMWDTKEDEEVEITNFNQIEISSLGLEIGNLAVRGVYVDGDDVTTQCTISGSNYDKIIALSLTDPLTITSRVIVKFTAPWASAARINVNLSHVE